MKHQSFQEILDSGSKHNLTFNVTESWCQGRTIWGGVLVAIVHNSMKRQVPADRKLRALQLTLAAPNSVGSLHISSEIIRQGKSVTSVHARISSGEQQTGVINAIYGASRESKIQFAPPRPLPFEHPLHEMQFQEGIMPSYIRHFDVHAHISGSVYRAKIRFHKGHADSLQTEHLLALTDVLPTPAYFMMDFGSNASTLNWSIDLIDDSKFPADLWWEVDAKLDAAENGYSSSTIVLINPNGDIAAISRQIVAIFS